LTSVTQPEPKRDAPGRPGTEHDSAPWAACPPDAIGEPVSAQVLRHQRNNAATGGIWRVRGTAGSAILKLATPPSPRRVAAWPTSDEPSYWNYWRRELLAYQSGLAATAYAEAGITAPGLLAAGARADGSVELWLADAGQADGFGWSVPRLARFAWQLGAAQARWAGRVPDPPWLSRRWLAQYLQHEPSLSAGIGAADWDHPVVAAWPATVRDRLRQLWAQRPRALAAAEAGQRTLCHLDVWPANLIDRDGESVLLDWAFTGDGAVGEDPANLILDSCSDGLMDAALLPRIAAGVTDGYLAGLRDGGWAGPADSVRAAIAACGAAKFSWFGPAMIGRAIRGELGNASYGQDTSAAVRIERLSGLVALIADWAAATLGD
jgi:hypothetical protein